MARQREERRAVRGWRRHVCRAQGLPEEGETALTGAAAARANARTLLELNRPAEALRALFASLAAEPDDAGALRLVGQAYIALDHTPKSSMDAIAAVTQSLALEPDNPHAFRILAIAHSRLRQHPRARAAALASVRVEPDQWQSHAALAEADAAARNITSETTDAVAAAQSLAPSNPEVHFVAGRVAAAQGNARAAAQHYERTLSLDPDHAGARNNLALIQMRRGNTGSAAASFVGLLSQNPNSPLALYNLRIAALRGLRIINLVLWIAVAIVNAVTQGDPNSRDHTPSIIIGVLAVLAIAGYVLWVRIRAGRAFSVFVRSIPKTDRIMSAWATFLSVTIVALIVAIFVPIGVTHAIYGAAAVGLFIGMVVMWFVSATLRPPTST